MQFILYFVPISLVVSTGQELSIWDKMDRLSNWMMPGWFSDNSVQMKRLRSKFETATPLWARYVEMKASLDNNPETIQLCEETEKVVLDYGESPSGVIVLLACILAFGSKVDERSDNIRDLIEVFTNSLNEIHVMYLSECMSHQFIHQSSISICNFHIHVLNALAGELIRQNSFDFYGNVLSSPITNIDYLKTLDLDLTHAMEGLGAYSTKWLFSQELIAEFLHSKNRSEFSFRTENLRLKDNALRIKFETEPMWPKYVEMKDSLDNPKIVGLCAETEFVVLEYGEVPSGMIVLLACNLEIGTETSERSNRIRDLIEMFSKTINTIREIYFQKCTMHVFTLDNTESLVSICNLHYHVLDVLAKKLVRYDDFELHANEARFVELDSLLSEALQKFIEKSLLMAITCDLIEIFLRNPSVDFFVNHHYELALRLSRRFQYQGRFSDFRQSRYESSYSDKCLLAESVALRVDNMRLSRFILEFCRDGSNVAKSDEHYVYNLE